MITVEAPLDPASVNRAASWLDLAARRLLIKNLSRIKEGTITLVEPGNSTTFGTGSDNGCLAATIYVHDPRFFGDVAFGGSIGAGEAYMRGHWTCDSLTDLTRLLLVNREALDGMENRAECCRGLLQKLLHAWHRNTRRGSRDNIAAHYDLGNDFFALFLDETLMYSCGIFEHAHSTLRDASLAKNERICRKLDLSPADHLLEIGTGWGGFALHAAQRFGCRVTTTTISREQYELADRRIRDAGLSDRVKVLCQDYRDLTGSYDKLVSIEMIEAVGHAYFDQYFAKCGSLLGPRGMMLLQAIVIPDQQFDVYCRSVDFIQRYIFPGGCLPSQGAIHRSIKSQTDFQATHLEDLTPHYARTLEAWRNRFLDNLPAVRTLGYSESFIRMWEFYLGYCEGAFQERSIGCIQLLLAKPRCRRMPILPPLD